jgi:hypothetical protein
MLEIDHLLVLRRDLVEFCVTSLCYDATLIHEIDRICTHDCREAVSDDDRGATIHEMIERILYESLCLGVESTRRLIEYEDLRISQYSPSYGDALLLSSRELESTLSDLCLPTFWE